MAIPALAYYLAAALFGGDLLARGLGQWGQYSLGKKQIAAGLKQGELQSKMGKSEEERMNALIEKLLKYKSKEKGEEREMEVMRTISAGRQNQSNLTLALLQQALASRPMPQTSTLPPASLLSLLR